MNKLLPLLCITSLFLSGCFQEKTTQEKTTPFRKYYDNGNPNILGYYLKKSGKKHGEWTYYFEDGKLMRTEKYEDGKIISKKGLTKIEKVFEKEELGWNYEPLNAFWFVDENNKVIGEWKLYDEDGDLRGIGFFKDGKKVGKWKFYNEWGSLKKIEHYKNDKLIKTENPL